MRNQVGPRSWLSDAGPSEPRGAIEIDQQFIGFQTLGADAATIVIEGFGIFRKSATLADDPAAVSTRWSDDLHQSMRGRFGHFDLPCQ